MLNEEYIWAAIQKSITIHSNHVMDIRDIKKDTKIIELFPTQTKKDEQANRLGMALLNILFYLNKKFKVNVKVDYKARQEFEKFKTVQDVYDYFYDKYSKKMG